MFVYATMPIAYKIGIPAFMLALFLSSGIVWSTADNIDELLSRLFFWSFSFFGISFAGIKIFDISLMLGLFLFLIKERQIKMRKELLVILPFFMYISFMWLSSDGDFIVQNENAGPGTELLRYLFAGVALFLFYQLRPNFKKMVYWLDLLVTAIVVQALLMFGMQDLKSVSDGIIQVSLYSVDALNVNSEARISAFFSDPNKMMAFFSILVLIRVAYLRLVDENYLKFDKFLILYLLGVILSLSRTGVIVVALFLLWFIVNIVIRTSSFANFLFWIFIGILILFYLLFKDLLLQLMSSFFRFILSVFGRTRTATIDSNVATDSRVIIWKQAFQYIVERPILGYGLLSESRLLPMPTHNTFIQQLMDNGIVGTILYFVPTLLRIAREINFAVVMIFLVVPMSFLDLGNFRIIFVLLGVLYIPRRFE